MTDFEKIRYNELKHKIKKIPDDCILTELSTEQQDFKKRNATFRKK